MTASAPISLNAGAESGDRASANTSCWFACKRRIDGRPIAPVAPAIKILIAVYSQHALPRKTAAPLDHLAISSHEPQFPKGIVNSVSFVSTTNTARSLADFVLLALALTTWRSPGSSEKLWPAL